MANNSTGNPWVLTDEAVIKTTRLTILYMEWFPSVASDDLTILDNGGNIIWDRNALTGGEAGICKFGPTLFRANGFNLSVIDGGTLYVYIK